MRTDKDAQFAVRNLNKLSKQRHAKLVKWLKLVLKDVELRKEDYVPVARWSLMK
jgi:hypothetical protein